MNDAISASRTNLPAPLYPLPLPSIPRDHQGHPAVSEDIILNSVEPTIDELVDEFQMYGKLAAEDHVRRSIPLARAKRQGQKRFKEFCERVGLKPESSTARKYLQIGKEADWLLTLSKHLPSEWTTIFAITVIGHAGAMRLVDAGALHPQVTGVELKRAVALHLKSSEDTSLASGTIQSCILKIAVSGRTQEECLNIYKEVKAAVAVFGLDVTGLPKQLSDDLIRETEAAQ